MVPTGQGSFRRFAACLRESRCEANRQTYSISAAVLPLTRAAASCVDPDRVPDARMSPPSQHTHGRAACRLRGLLKLPGSRDSLSPYVMFFSRAPGHPSRTRGTSRYSGSVQRRWYSNMPMTMRSERVKERLVNIFVYGDAAHVHAIGWRIYDRTGTYDELIRFLQTTAKDDHRIAERRHLDEPVQWKEFDAMNRLNPFFRTLVQADVVSENDVYCVTPVVNGEVRVDDVYDAESVAAVPDYLTVYRSKRGFEFAQLINDDYFEAIHLLWNNRKYVSCLKLIFSMIDTLGFVEYGPYSSNSFARWLDDYCDIESLGVTSGELWEMRNSLIHMTNLDSRKVRSGRTHRVLPRFAHPDMDLTESENGMKVLHVARFVMAVLPRGIGKWLDSYNRNRGKFAQFVERYDTVVSEARLTYTDFKRKD